MPQVHVDPEKLRSFAAELKRFAKEVEGQVNGLGNDLARLAQTWRDQEYERFVEEFVATQRQLQVFAEEVRTLAPLLEQDAEAVEKFLRSRG
ncbi:WXG100 family type VII secretion target [Limisphaera sp. VF-2]|jgi:WXG100 family type VII secretion target|uniref:WXG100 family type VII secretion target n=1 Tax=Limisphaera sp. VF-2 TaxID=3400418 RepID=UPI003C19039A